MHVCLREVKYSLFSLKALLFTAFLVTVLKILTYALVSTWSLVSSGYEHVKRKMHPWLTVDKTWLGLRSIVYLQDNPFITETLSAEKQVAWHEAGTRKRLARTSIGHHYSVWAAPNIWTCQYQIFGQTTTKIWTASGQIAGFDNTEYLDLIIVWSWH